jgi:hypothetical protein
MPVRTGPGQTKNLGLYYGSNAGFNANLDALDQVMGAGGAAGTGYPLVRTRSSTVSTTATAASDDVIFAQNTGAAGSVVVTLPLASSVPGKVFTVHAGTSTATSTITASGADKLNSIANPAVASLTLALKTALTLASDGGTNWWVVGSNVGT